ncbi:DUF3575 domain-containing protein [Psychroserpens algicola]|uniref:DUF3575 domain-containing protein n=1 Tax=Psychroserpens algicola TaxID=1719034 RepID=A0ABT0H4C0_9FLAO|nr:DUF3575 domain-containing protein [Psychroserpens algicola]MCK8479216.1 DUF3575 domain-containing protein [Psychroserpens algicola]
MKNSILCAFVFLFTIPLFAQDEDIADQDVDFPKSEVKLNALSLIVGAFEGTYEYLLNEESAIGINGFVVYDNDLDTDLNYYISPYYRLYFGEKYAAGFFLEGFGMLNNVEGNRITYFNNQGDILSVEEDNITDFALGIGLGGKWVTNNGFVGELSLGVGRNLFNANESGIDFVGKLGITVGYRF